MDIWRECHRRMVEIRLQGTLWRVVESQEQVATNSLVDSFDEQALLERMLDASKPLSPVMKDSLNYLLSTPFRYPPLRHGSRFGDRFSPALFYGSRQWHTALAESAYYRFLFWAGMAAPPPSGRFVSGHTLFSARLAARRGVCLQHSPFDTYRAELTSPVSYRHTQALGTALRGAGIEAFEYVSARCRDGGINVALFTPDAFAAARPQIQQPWLCETAAESVKFSNPGEGVVAFPLEEYLVEGRLPQPSAADA